jgi:hypothetical protein
MSLRDNKHKQTKHGTARTITTSMSAPAKAQVAEALDYLSADLGMEEFIYDDDDGDDDQLEHIDFSSGNKMLEMQRRIVLATTK